MAVDLMSFRWNFLYLIYLEWNILAQEIEEPHEISKLHERALNEAFLAIFG